MKNLAIFFVVFIYSCVNMSDKENKKHVSSDSVDTSIQLSKTFQTLSTANQIDTIIKTFLQENNCDSCIHEIYIDKITPFKTIVTLRARIYSLEYLKNKDPLFTIKFYGTPFYLYSGIEDILVGDKKLMTYTGKEKEGKFGDWNIILDSGKVEVKKIDVGIPFYQSSPPKIRINSK